MLKDDLTQRTEHGIKIKTSQKRAINFSPKSKFNFQLGDSNCNLTDLEREKQENRIYLSSKRTT